MQTVIFKMYSYPVKYEVRVVKYEVRIMHWKVLQVQWTVFLCNMSCVLCNPKYKSNIRKYDMCITIIFHA
jgi:hypothetical protein